MIYEIETEDYIIYKALSHIEPFEFLKLLLAEYNVKANLGDIKQGWEKERSIKTSRRKRVNKYFPCQATDWGAYPVTFCRVKK